MDEFKRKFRGKLAFYIIIYSVFLYIFSWLPPFCYAEPFSLLHNPVWLFLYALFGFSVTLFLIKISSSTRRKTTGDYEREENRFEESSNQLILNAFGYEIFEKLYMNGIGIENLIQKEQSEKDLDLRFCLYVKLAMGYARDGQIKKAIQTFHEALSIKPTDLIANFRIATLYESIGLGDKAILHYQLVKKYNTLAGNFDDYLDSQIKRIMTNGPRKRGPYDGSGLQWLS